MPISKKRMRELKRKERLLREKARDLHVTEVLSAADVRAIRLANLDPEDIEAEENKVSSNIFYALMRDRDAARAHLDWHHDAIDREKREMAGTFDNYELRHGLIEAQG